MEYRRIAKYVGHCVMAWWELCERRRGIWAVTSYGQRKRARYWLYLFRETAAEQKKRRNFGTFCPDCRKPYSMTQPKWTPPTAREGLGWAPPPVREKKVSPVHAVRSEVLITRDASNSSVIPMRVLATYHKNGLKLSSSESAFKNSIKSQDQDKQEQQGAMVQPKLKAPPPEWIRGCISSHSHRRPLTSHNFRVWHGRWLAKKESQVADIADSDLLMSKTERYHETVQVHNDALTAMAMAQAELNKPSSLPSMCPHSSNTPSCVGHYSHANFGKLLARPPQQPRPVPPQAEAKIEMMLHNNPLARRRVNLSKPKASSSGLLGSVEVARAGSTTNRAVSPCAVGDEDVISCLLESVGGGGEGTGKRLREMMLLAGALRSVGQKCL